MMAVLMLLVALPTEVFQWGFLPGSISAGLAGQSPAPQGRGPGGLPAVPLWQEEPPWPP